MLKSLKLENFRNHRSFLIEFEQVTVIIGENGIGKSNILEAISVLSACRSFREDDKKNLVMLECDFARITAGELEIFIQRCPNTLFKTKHKGVFKKQADFVGNLRSVVFSPETMEIVGGTPKLRRRFLDVMISQKDHGYLRALMSYEKIRQERNSLLGMILEGRAKVEELGYWDQELIRFGTIILEKRISTVRFVNKNLADLYRAISGKESEDLQIIFESNTTIAEFGMNLKENRRREICSKHTITGPHRDDFFFSLNGYNLANYGSRGEVRSAVLALIIAELEFLSEEDFEKPILLLDDVFSEIDEKRRGHLGELIKQYQTVITTTDLSHLSGELLKRVKIVELGG